MDYALFSILIFGIIIGIPVAIAIMAAANKDKKIRSKYDERQKAIRGKAYMIGFYAMVGAEAILTLLSTLGLTKVLGHYGFFLVMIIGIIAQFSYAVFKDAYVGLNANIKKYIVFMTIIALINLAAAVAGIVDGTMFVDGVLQTPFMNALCAIMMIILGAEFIVKKCIDKKA